MIGCDVRLNIYYRPLVRKMIPAIFAGLAVTASASGAQSQVSAPSIRAIRILDFGLYKYTQTESTVVAPNSATGILKLGESIHVRTTRTIPGRLGIHFGFHYVLVGQPADADVTVKVVDLFPSPGIRDPSTRVVRRSSYYEYPARIGSLAGQIYGFENTWEIIPGTWSFQIWYQGRKLAEQHFTVVKQ